jgi:hypothetical protein
MSKNKFATLKKAIAISMVSIWVALLFQIFKSGGAMSSQLPKCIFTTITIFAILNLTLKGIEYLEKKQN